MKLNNITNWQFRTDFHYCQEHPDFNQWSLIDLMEDVDIEPITQFDSTRFAPNKSIIQDIRLVCSSESAEELAIAQRAMWGNARGPLQSVGTTLQDNGIQMAWMTLPSELNHVLGFSAIHDKTDIVLVANTTAHTTRERIRFTMLYLAARQVLRYPKGMDERNRQRYACRFVSALLLPSQDLVDSFRFLPNRECDQLEQSLIDTHNRYGIAVASSINRFTHAGIISEELRTAYHEKLIYPDFTESKYSPRINPLELQIWNF